MIMRPYQGSWARVLVVLVRNNKREWVWQSFLFVPIGVTLLHRGCAQSPAAYSGSDAHIHRHHAKPLSTYTKCDIFFS
jgi:hypothetical protein